MTKIRITSSAIHPVTTHYAGGAEIGTAFAAHRYNGPTSSAVGPEWPPLEVGAIIEIADTQAWIWDAQIARILEPGERLEARILGERRPQPLPHPAPDGTLALPNMSGHAHARGWRQGDIVTSADWQVAADEAEARGEPRPPDHFRVARKPRMSRGGAEITYTLEPCSAEQYATRPGRVVISTERAAHEAIGSAVQTPKGEWLHVAKVERSTFHGALGRGETWWIAGRHVSAEKAAKLNDLHGPTLSLALALARSGERVSTPLPADATVLVPRDGTSLAATEERIAIVDGTVLHERCGDPDMSDSWHPYVVAVRDPALVERARAFVRARRRA